MNTDHFNSDALWYAPIKGSQRGTQKLKWGGSVQELPGESLRKLTRVELRLPSDTIEVVNVIRSGNG